MHLGAAPPRARKRAGLALIAAVSLTVAVAPPAVLAAVQPAAEPRGIKAVVVKSWSHCGSGGVVWDQLNADWSSYGAVPITIDYADPSLCGTSFTLEALEASHADVVILDDPAGAGYQFTAEEIEALTTYAGEGHDLIGTFLTFHWSYGGDPIDNSGLAPLFGLVQRDGWSGGRNRIDAKYELLDHKRLAVRLIRELPNPYGSDGYHASQFPGDGTWGKDDLAGATLIGINASREAVITVYRAATYRAIYIANMPEYHGGASDMQFLYNAIIYPKQG